MKKNRVGFTLIEIILVIVIAAIVLALAVPNFAKGFSGLNLNKTVDDLLSISRWAQAMAIEQDRTYALSFADDRRSYGLERAMVNEDTGEQQGFEPVKGSLGRMHDLPDGIELKTDINRVEFYPDGTIDGDTIELDSAQQNVEISSTQVRGMMTKVDHE